MANNRGKQSSKIPRLSDHLDDLVLSSNVKTGLLQRILKTREAEPIMKMFNSFIKSKLDYCCNIGFHLSRP